MIWMTLEVTLAIRTLSYTKFTNILENIKYII